VTRNRGRHPPRRATVRTAHGAADLIAAAVRPDHTGSVSTTVRDGRIETRIERPTTGGLRATVDDYVVNLGVADATLAAARRHAGGDGDDPPDGGDRARDAEPTDGTGSTTDDATTTRDTRDGSDTP